MEKQGLQREAAVKEAGNKTRKDKIQLLERAKEGKRKQAKGKNYKSRAQGERSGTTLANAACQPQDRTYP